MKNIDEMNYSEFCEYLDGEGYERFDPILTYDEFTVYMDLETSRYYYLEGGENDASDFFALELAAILCYDEENDIKIKEGETLSHLFDCCVCGERVINDGIQYLWFKRKETKEDEGL